MYDVKPFQPLYSPNAGGAAGGLIASVTITATTASSIGTLLPGNLGTNDFCQIQIANTVSAWAYVNFGRTTGEIAAATVAAGYPIAPGGVVVVTVNSEVAAVTVILGSSSGAVIFTRGTGS